MLLKLLYLTKIGFKALYKFMLKKLLNLTTFGSNYKISC